MTATANTASKFDAMGKEELRAACREAGVSYSKLNNDGMRAALTAHYASLEVAEAATEEVAAQEEVVQQPARPNVFAQMLGLESAPLPVGCGAGTRVVDGKKVDPNASKAKGESRARVEKNPAPAVPRVSRKGYTIQKEREERNGVKRPSEGTVCGAVWAEFDKNPEIKASELADLADTNGWNRTNVSCEFYAWRKFNGIKGRRG